MPLHFHRLTEEDLPTLADWLTRPHIAEWWDACRSLDELREKHLAGTTDGSAAVPYRAYHDAVPLAHPVLRCGWDGRLVARRARSRSSRQVPYSVCDF